MSRVYVDVLGHVLVLEGPEIDKEDEENGLKIGSWKLNLYLDTEVEEEYMYSILGCWMVVHSRKK